MRVAPATRRRRRNPVAGDRTALCGTAAAGNRRGCAVAPPRAAIRAPPAQNRAGRQPRLLAPRRASTPAPQAAAEGLIRERELFDAGTVFRKEMTAISSS